MKQYPNIDAIIEDSDTKVQDLAKVIGVSTKQIRRWRDGTSEMGIEKLEKLCRYYHVSATTFWGCPEIWTGPEGDEDPGQLSIL